MKKLLYYNKTFRIGNDLHLNACVGKNGYQDFRKYGLGYDETVKVLITAAKQYDVTVDAIIYPLVFCARHRIELFLKDQLVKFTLIRNHPEITEKLLNNTHDLNKLWGLFKLHGLKTDKRFVDFIDRAEEYVMDFSEVDPTGETFRYPYTKLKSLHLEDISIINIAIFEKRYLQLSELMERFEYLTMFLIEEYQQKTFTKELSREDIREISKLLPLKEKWSLPNFDDIRANIRDKYKLSSNSLSTAINIIKLHREFCTNIGLELPLTQINKADLYLLINVFEKYQNVYTKADSAETRNKQKMVLVGQLASELPGKAIICFFTLVELGKLDYYSEAFDFLFQRHEGEAVNYCDLNFYCSVILNNIRALDYIRNALKKLGQISLINAFDAKKKIGISSAEAEGT